MEWILIYSFHNQLFEIMELPILFSIPLMVAILFIFVSEKLNRTMKKFNQNLSALNVVLSQLTINFELHRELLQEQIKQIRSNQKKILEAA